MSRVGMSTGCSRYEKVCGIVRDELTNERVKIEINKIIDRYNKLLADFPTDPRLQAIKSIILTLEGVGEALTGEAPPP